MDSKTTAADWGGLCSQVRQIKIDVTVKGSSINFSRNLLDSGSNISNVSSEASFKDLGDRCQDIARRFRQLSRSDSIQDEADKFEIASGMLRGSTLTTAEVEGINLKRRVERERFETFEMHSAAAAVGGDVSTDWFNKERAYAAIENTKEISENAIAVIRSAQADKKSPSLVPQKHALSKPLDEVGRSPIPKPGRGGVS